MASSLADKILVGVDVLLLCAVGAAGVAGDSLSLPRGQEEVVFNKPEPAIPPKPGQAEWDRFYFAKERGLKAMNLAQECKPTDFSAKRKYYDEAEKAFKEALETATVWKACEGVDPSLVDAQVQEVRTYLVGVHKSRPIMGK